MSLPSFGCPFARAPRPAKRWETTYGLAVSPAPAVAANPPRLTDLSSSAHHVRIGALRVSAGQIGLGTTGPAGAVALGWIARVRRSLSLIRQRPNGSPARRRRAAQSADTSRS
jgi:hypothetical protein